MIANELVWSIIDEIERMEAEHGDTATVEVEVNGYAYMAIDEGHTWPFPNLGGRRKVGMIAGRDLYVRGDMAPSGVHWRVIAAAKARRA